MLDKAAIGRGTRVLDCGCGAGRFARMAADRGASVAGIDAAGPLVHIATERTPSGDFHVGDFEALPWSDDSFDLAAGFSTFQFADDKVAALREAWRVSHDSVVVAIPSRVQESGIAAVFAPVMPLFPPEASEALRQSGIFALSGPGALDDVLAAAGLEVRSDDEIECPITFADADVALRAFTGAGPMRLAIQHAGDEPVAAAVRDALGPHTGADGRVTLSEWYRVVFAAS